MNTTPEAIVREFWRLMASNDFDSVRQVLSQDFVLEWPQSRERIRGADNFARMNSEYPSSGRWQFQINRLLSQGEAVVTQVSLTDGTQSAEPISFFTVEQGRISRLVEYWPDPFEPQANRSHLVERMG
ncbi:nuclear transport factor 2 family protein [Paucibacter sp. O1-1]|nr:nuclear transport factor 2 family protein [Paucibacter sp. O1-1]MDA3826914.1 nuclear transport factor 2 family protein [Paucibacter sp. O1-1]